MRHKLIAQNWALTFDSRSTFGWLRTALTNSGNPSPSKSPDASSALPPLPFVVFAPAASAFRTIHTPPVVLRVVARDPTRPLPPRVQRLIAQFEPEPASGPWLWLGLGAGVAVFVIAVVGLRRGRRRRA